MEGISVAHPVATDDRIMRRATRAPGQIGTISALLACAACHPVSDPPPPTVYFDGLPVSGRLIDAKRAAFDECVNLDAVHIRCRRHDVMIEGTGPYDAAVDLAGSNGEGGFDQLTLWDDHDNEAVFRITSALERSGWLRCLTGNGRTGDQAIYMRKGSPVRISMDISYWAKRRLRVIPHWNQRESHCTPAWGEKPLASAVIPRGGMTLASVVAARVKTAAVVSTKLIPTADTTGSVLRQILP